MEHATGSRADTAGSRAAMCTRSSRQVCAFPARPSPAGETLLAPVEPLPAPGTRSQPYRLPPCCRHAVALPSTQAHPARHMPCSGHARSSASVCRFGPRPVRVRCPPTAAPPPGPCLSQQGTRGPCAAVLEAVAPRSSRRSHGGGGGGAGSSGDGIRRRDGRRLAAEAGQLRGEPPARTR